jgi:hypothetical protein
MNSRRSGARPRRPSPPGAWPRDRAFPPAGEVPLAADDPPVVVAAGAGERRLQVHRPVGRVEPAGRRGPAALLAVQFISAPAKATGDAAAAVDHRRGGDAGAGLAVGASLPVPVDLLIGAGEAEAADDRPMRDTPATCREETDDECQVVTRNCSRRPRSTSAQGTARPDDHLPSRHRAGVSRSALR